MSEPEEPATAPRESSARPTRGRQQSELYGVAVGDVISGKFRIERILGEGGMGLVVAATHLGLDEPVALKFLNPNGCKNREQVARFFQEAKAAAKLKSEHVAHVLDVSQREDGTPYIVMEYLHGSDLRQVLGFEGRLPIESAVEYVIQACEGLAEAHSRGIVHRDIKPENLFLVERSVEWRVVKILDFGISKAMLESAITSDANIRTGAIMGSPCYMSPEQLRETSSVDLRTDIWALGAVLYELLCGVSAFDASLPLTNLILQIVTDPPLPLRSRRGDVPTELAAIVGKCLQKDREARFPNAAELAVALLPFAPRRARVAAERAVSVTRASPSSPRIQLPFSSAPPQSEELASTALAIETELVPLSSEQIITGDPITPRLVLPLVRRVGPPSRGHLRHLGGGLVAIALAIVVAAWMVRPRDVAPIAVAAAPDRAAAMHEGPIAPAALDVPALVVPAAAPPLSSATPPFRTPGMPTTAAPAPAPKRPRVASPIRAATPTSPPAASREPSLDIQTHR